MSISYSIYTYGMGNYPYMYNYAYGQPIHVLAGNSYAYGSRKIVHTQMIQNIGSESKL